MGDNETVTLHEIGPSTDIGWALMPQLLRRIVRFGERYPTEQYVNELCQAMLASFLSNAGTVRAWGAVDSDGLLAAHVVAALDVPRRIIFIYQLEIDRPIPFSVKKAALAAVEGWGAACQARAIEALTWHDARIWRRYGFSLHRVVVRRTLGATNG